MSTRFFDQARGAHFSDGAKHGQQQTLCHLDYEMRRPPKGASHYFKVYRLGEDMCAMCQKPRSEHPKVKS